MSISEYDYCEDCYCDYNDYSDDYCSDDDDYCSDNEYDLDHIYEKMIKNILEWAKTHVILIPIQLREYKAIMKGTIILQKIKKRPLKTFTLNST